VNFTGTKFKALWTRQSAGGSSILEMPRNVRSMPETHVFRNPWAMKTGSTVTSCHKPLAAAHWELAYERASGLKRRLEFLHFPGAGGCVKKARAHDPGG
jgi:hypothetical protein